MFKQLILLVGIICLAVLFACSKNHPTDDDGGNGNGNGFLPVYPSAYDCPSWSPDGQMIVFYYRFITAVDSSSGDFWFNPDSTGIWAIDPDGNNLRMLLQGPGVDLPDVSPDGQWLAFEYGAQIYKARLVNGVVDMGQIVQLTTEGRNFFPAWSPDGQWILFHNTSCGNAVEPAPSNSCGGLLINLSSGEIRKVIDGATPDWHFDNVHCVFIGLHYEIFIGSITDTSVVKLTSLNEDDIYATGNTLPKFSPDGSRIAFTSQSKWVEPQPINSNPPRIWLMNADGTNPHPLTDEAGEYASWSPDGQHLVYLFHNWLKFDENNGTLWIMDADGENKRQLTFNRYPFLKRQGETRPGEHDVFVSASQTLDAYKKFIPPCD